MIPDVQIVSVCLGQTKPYVSRFGSIQCCQKKLKTRIAMNLAFLGIFCMIQKNISYLTYNFQITAIRFCFFPLPRCNYACSPVFPINLLKNIGKFTFLMLASIIVYLMKRISYIILLKSTYSINQWFLILSDRLPLPDFLENRITLFWQFARFMSENIVGNELMNQKSLAKIHFSYSH